jgi:hypothetical protein
MPLGIMPPTRPTARARRFFRPRRSWPPAHWLRTVPTKLRCRFSRRSFGAPEAALLPAVWYRWALALPVVEGLGATMEQTHSGIIISLSVQIVSADGMSAANAKIILLSF